MILGRNCESVTQTAGRRGGRVYYIVASEERMEASEFMNEWWCVNVCQPRHDIMSSYLPIYDPVDYIKPFLVSASPTMLKYNSLPLTWKLDESLLAIIIIIINLYHSRSLTAYRWHRPPSFWPSCRRSSRPASCPASAAAAPSSPGPAASEAAPSPGTACRPW